MPAVGRCTKLFVKNVIKSDIWSNDKITKYK